MNIHINTVTQCSGGSHRIFDMTVGGQTFVLTISKDDVTSEPDNIKDAVFDRLRSALKEAGATMALATWKTALEGKDFKI